MSTPKKIAIFASGNGSNAENIALHFESSLTARVVLVVTNNPHAFVLERAKKLSIATQIFSKQAVSEATELIKALKQAQVDWVVLAGFLLKIPPALIDAYPEKIINIHPALLPKYGGKGMYGNFVHQAVVNNHEVETGITIHYVNEQYDEGAIIFQSKTAVLPLDTAKDVAEKIAKLEKAYFPLVIEQLIKTTPE